MWLVFLLALADEALCDYLQLHSYSLLHNRAWKVEWGNSYAAADGYTYTVKYCDTLYYLCKNTFPVSTTYVVLSDLYPDRDYYVTITANLESWKSRTVKFHTLRSINCQHSSFYCSESSKEPFEGLLCKKYSEHLLPCITISKPPTVTSFHIIKTTPTSIVIQWVPIEDKGIEINNYTLTCFEGGKRMIFEKVYPSNSVSHVMTTTFDRLKINHFYQFEISTFNFYGKNVWSNTLHGTTSNDSRWFPSLIPNDINAEPISFAESSSYIISWKFLSYLKEVLFLSVRYCDEKNNCKVTRKTVNNNVTIVSLTPGSCYSLSMDICDAKNVLLWKKSGGRFCTSDRDRCKGFSCATVSQCVPYNKICDGKRDCLDSSDETEKHAKCTLPPSINNLQIFKTGDTFIHVRWKTLDLITLNVNGYEVLLTNANISETIIKKAPVGNVGKSFLNASFVNLIPQTTYNLTIRALNPFGYGNWAMPITVETDSKVGLPGVVGPHLTEYLLREDKLIWKISWTPPELLGNNDVNELSYVFRYCKINSMQSATCNSLRTNVTYVKLQLWKNKFYQYSIVAYNKYGHPSKRKRSKNFLTKRSQAAHSITCVNEFFIRFDLNKRAVGRYPTVTVGKNIYPIYDSVRFECPQEFHIAGGGLKKRQSSFCQPNGQWSIPWPMCRGKLENVTCKNEYETSFRDGRSWQNPTLNRIHANYGPIKGQYYYGDTLHFECKKDHTLVRTKGLTVMRTTCQRNGKWTSEWPLCKGKTCDRLKIRHAYVSNQDIKRSVGVVAVITCQKGFYLWGSDTSECLHNLEWSGSKHRACYSDYTYKKVCKEDGGVMEKSACIYPVLKQQSSSHHTTYLAIGTAIPMSVAFLVTMVGAVFYVRYKRSQLTRYVVTSRYDGNETVNLILPSYSESEKNKPTTLPPPYEDSSDQNNTTSSELTSAAMREERDLPPAYSERVEAS